MVRIPGSMWRLRGPSVRAFDLLSLTWLRLELEVAMSRPSLGLTNVERLARV